jgi:thymidylate kinase
VSARGRFVVLLGPDGCGKSSVLAGVARALAPEFAGVEARHHRPQARWGAGRAVDRPHALPPRSIVGSALKLALDWLRFLVGYVRTVRPAVAEGKLVLFDRYYHDVLADPRRYRYGGPAWLASRVGRLVPAPDLFVVLDAPPEVLQARKAEVSPAASAAAREAYRALAGILPRARVVDGARPLDRVVDEVAALVRAA